MSTQAKISLLGVLIAAVIGVVIWDRSTIGPVKKGPDLARAGDTVAAPPVTPPAPAATPGANPESYRPVEVSPGPREAGPIAPIGETGGTAPAQPVEAAKWPTAKVPTPPVAAAPQPAAVEAPEPAREPKPEPQPEPQPVAVTPPMPAATPEPAQPMPATQPPATPSGVEAATPVASSPQPGPHAVSEPAPGESVPAAQPPIAVAPAQQPPAQQPPAQQPPVQQPPAAQPEPQPAAPPAQTPAQPEQPTAAQNGVLGGVNYTVQPGDHLWGLAQKFYKDGMKWKEIFEANKDVLTSETANLVVGTILRIPEIKVEPPKVAPPAAAPAVPAGQRTWTVHQGDTLVEIAKKVYGSSKHWRAIAEANKKELPDPDRPKVGQVLLLPEIKEQPKAAPAKAPGDELAGKDVYTVKEGDNLETLAERFYHDRTQWMKIFEANKARMKDVHTLRVGQKLQLPGVDVEAIEGPKAKEAPKGEKGTKGGDAKGNEPPRRSNPPPAPVESGKDSTSDLGTPVRETSLIHE